MYAWIDVQVCIFSMYQILRSMYYACMHVCMGYQVLFFVLSTCIRCVYECMCTSECMYHVHTLYAYMHVLLLCVRCVRIFLILVQSIFVFYSSSPLSSILFCKTLCAPPPPAGHLVLLTHLVFARAFSVAWWLVCSGTSTLPRATWR